LCVGDPSVSRRHCLIFPRESEFLIRDLGSNNGTFVNGSCIDECILADGDKIRVGDTVFRFALTEDTVPEERLNLPDNGVVAKTALEQQISGSTTTGMNRLFETVGRDGAGAARAMVLL
jgi:pSer/pThr/pTyr-binding forkhead associated (FHA) protein